jgi:hypothetical protein|tara:strand:- start:549 stop:1397 length:849 start_codon:yes stop_codon:yes gene_type:complete
MNEIAVIDKASELELARMLGTNNSNDNDRVPRIKYCMDRKDNQGRSLADFYMNMYLENQDDPIYSDSISIRVLSQKFQWLEYDPEKEITRNKTILVNRLLDEARDQLGSVRCGKPVSKVLRAMPEDEQKKFQNIKCQRQLRCLVSYTGKTADGESHSVENIPALFVLRGSNFMGFEDEVIKKMPRSRNFYEFNIEVSYEEMKTGTVYYPVYHFNPDLANLIPLDEETVETMQVFAEQIKQENDQIERAHRNAMEKRNLNDDAADAIDGVAYESLDDDLKDSE